MQIFKLSENPYDCATCYDDVRLRKGIVEMSQLLANAFPLETLKNAPKTQSGKNRGYSHYFHPVAVWTRLNINNFNWAKNHALGLCQEFTFRFNKRHFCQDFIEWCLINNPPLSNGGLSEQPQCFLAHPDCLVPNNPVAGYRNYYNKCKLSFTIRGKTVKANWTKRPIPDFIDLNKLNT